jgi:transposase
MQKEEHYMESILYVGMDVHTSNYTLCTYSIEDDKEFGLVKFGPDHLNIVRYVKRLKEHHGQDTRIVCGYEAGGLGYSLYRILTANNIECVILAPSTMPKAPNERKTDYRDAAKIARCLAYNSYRSVYIPDAEDEAVKEYIRMRDNTKDHIKQLKQRILALCTRWRKEFNGTKKFWTIAHMKWLQHLEFENPVAQEAFDEYVIQLNEANARLKRYDERIEKWAELPRYAEKVSKLTCFCGIKTHVALATIAEVSDFDRFPNANRFASYLGLVPGEYSSGNNVNRLGITKQGNSHIRKLLTEAAQCYARALPGKTSAELLRRQQGNDPKVIAYANKGNERLKRRFRSIAARKPKPLAVTAIARELACFIWGMMTDHLEQVY